MPISSQCRACGKQTIPHTDQPLKHPKSKKLYPAGTRMCIPCAIRMEQVPEGVILSHALLYAADLMPPVRVVKVREAFEDDPLTVVYSSLKEDGTSRPLVANMRKALLLLDEETAVPLNKLIRQLRDDYDEEARRIKNQALFAFESKAPNDVVAAVEQFLGITLK